MRFSLRKLLAAMLVIALVFAMTQAVRRSIVGRSRVSQRIRVKIESLESAKPPNLTTAQWQVMVDWTCNLHGNSMLPFQTSLIEILAFESRLDERLSGEVDASTIEWIWDQFDAVCDGGHRYQRFRLHVNEALSNCDSPVMLDPPSMSQVGR